jgi:hypothetical protein
MIIQYLCLGILKNQSSHIFFEKNQPALKGRDVVSVLIEAAAWPAAPPPSNMQQELG